MIERLKIGNVHLLRRDLVGHRPHVNLLKDVDARDDKEDARTSSSPREKSTKTEDHRPFIFLIDCHHHNICYHIYLSYIDINQYIDTFLRINIDIN